MGSDEVLPMDPPFHLLLVKPTSSKGKKKREVGRVRSSREAAKADDEEEDDDKDVDTHSSQPQHPFSSHRVEEDLAAVQRDVGGTSAGASALVPSSTALEVEMLRCQLQWEKRKNIEGGMFHGLDVKGYQGDLYLHCPQKEITVLAS